MNISIQTDPYRELKDAKKIIRLFKDVGFDNYDFSMFHRIEEMSNVCFFLSDDYLQKAKSLRKYADEIGIKCNQAHAPFPTLRFIDGVEDLNYFDHIKRSIEIASILGAKNIVVHPMNNFSPKENKAMYERLIPLARKCHIKIAIENMWNWNKETDHASFASCSSPEDFIANIDQLPSDVFTCCLDIGHAEMMDFTNAVEMIKALGKRIGCIHVHDNDRWHDNHAMPFTMNIDFKPIMEALKEANYEGDLNLEVEVHPNDLTYEAHKDLAIKSFEVANKLKAMFDNYGN